MAEYAFEVNRMCIAVVVYPIMRTTMTTRACECSIDSLTTRTNLIWIKFPFKRQIRATIELKEKTVNLLHARYMESLQVTEPIHMNRKPMVCAPYGLIAYDMGRCGIHNHNLHPNKEMDIYKIFISCSERWFAIEWRTWNSMHCEAIKRARTCTIQSHVCRIVYEIFI